MREDIISFVREPGRPQPFFVEMTGISWCDSSYRIARTNSPISVVEYVIEGKGTVHVDGHSFTASAGDVYLLHRGSTHWYVSDGDDPWVKVWMNIGGPLVDSLIWDYGLNKLNHVQGLDIQAMLQQVYDLAQEAHDDPDCFFAEASVAFHRIVQRIHLFTQKDESQRQPEAVRMKLWLDRHLYERTDIAETAAQVFRSPSQAIRIFKREFGVTPIDYLLGQRVETAKLLLRNTNLQVKEIAYRLCFADEHYFSNYFKKRVGVAPGEYRIKL